MRIAVLFDGAGLARLGLEQAGHKCTGVELDPVKHHFSRMVGSGNSIHMDVMDFVRAGRLHHFDAVWASPPCARRSTAIKDLTGRGGLRNRKYQRDYLSWCIRLSHIFNAVDRPIWIENVTTMGGRLDTWGTTWNAAQFGVDQNRNRVIGGKYILPSPASHFPFKRAFPGLCPCISATEYKGCATDRLRASRFYGRRLTYWECAAHQGFSIPEGWLFVPRWYLPDAQPRNRLIQWERRIYEAIGDGVPPLMAKRFGEVYV